MNRIKEPRLGMIQTPSKPIASYFSALELISIRLRGYSISAQRNSQGISSKATILSKKAKIAWAFAGIQMAKNGIKMVIYYEATKDSNVCKIPAMTAFKSTLLANEPVSTGFTESCKALNTYASAALANCVGICFSKNDPFSISYPK